jgi:hypothetical protein
MDDGRQVMAKVLIKIMKYYENTKYTFKLEALDSL